MIRHCWITAIFAAALLLMQVDAKACMSTQINPAEENEYLVEIKYQHELDSVASTAAEDVFLDGDCRRFSSADQAVPSYAAGSIIGVNIDLRSPINYVRRVDLGDLDLLSQNLSIKWIRIWAQATFESGIDADTLLKRDVPYPREWWNSIKEIVFEAKKRGLNTLIVINGAPEIVRGKSLVLNEYPDQQMPTNMGKRLIKNLASDMCGIGVDAVQIYNELNFEKHFRPGENYVGRADFDSISSRAADYADLWVSTVQQVSDYGLHCRIISAAPAPVGYYKDLGGRKDRLSAIEWIEILLRESGSRLASVRKETIGIAVHPYPPFDANKQPLDWSVSWRRKDDAPNWHGMTTVLQIKDRISAVGLKPNDVIFATETGLPGTDTKLCSDCLSESEQARFIGQVVIGWVSKKWLGLWNSPIFVYQLRDRASLGLYVGNKEGYFGLMDGARKKSSFELLACLARKSIREVAAAGTDSLGNINICPLQGMTKQ